MHVVSYFAHVVTSIGASVWSSWLCPRLASERQTTFRNLTKSLLKETRREDAVRATTGFIPGGGTDATKLKNVKVEVHDRREAQSVLSLFYPQPYLSQASIFRLQQIYGVGKNKHSYVYVCMYVCMYMYLHICNIYIYMCNYIYIHIHI